MALAAYRKHFQICGKHGDGAEGVGRRPAFGPPLATGIAGSSGNPVKDGSLPQFSCATLLGARLLTGRLSREGVTDMGMSRTCRAASLAVIALAILLARDGPALAHIEGSDPTLSEWFDSLLAPDSGVPCCNLVDCVPVPSRQLLGSWQAWRNGQWLDVPGDKVVTDTTNPLASAVLCWSRTLGMTCFIPPPGGHRRNPGV